jgi:hypothetical protein
VTAAGPAAHGVRPGGAPPHLTPMIDQDHRRALLVPAFILWLMAVAALLTAAVASPPRSDLGLWRQLIAHAEAGDRSFDKAQALKELRMAVNLIEAQRRYHDLLRDGVGALGALLAVAGGIQLRAALSVLARVRHQASAREGAKAPDGHRVPACAPLASSSPAS